MSRVAIIGYGNVGFHLAGQISKKHEIAIFGRTTNDEIRPLEDFNSEDFDFAILAVPDGAIKELAYNIKPSDCLILHTSGSRPLSDLSTHDRSGVMYPLQTFTIEKEVDFTDFPMFIEGKDDTEKTIFSFVRSFSTDVRLMNSANRSRLHLAAVFACNFTNHMYHLCDEILSEMELSFSEMKHLALETLQKASEISPHKAQTGPAIRGDKKTMETHIQMLKDEDTKTIYKLLSAQIRKSQQ